MENLLFESPQGVKFIRTDYKKRSKVVVKYQNRHIITYRFNNIPEYKHKYLSWENLNCCEGWVYDKSYLRNAVQNDKKLVATVVEFFDNDDDINGWIDSLKIDNNLIYGQSNEKTSHYNEIITMVTITLCKKGTLSDYFDFNDVIKHYSLLLDDCIYDLIKMEVLYEMFNKPINEIVIDNSEFNIYHVNVIEDIIYLGLILGYPIESTASLLSNY